MIPEQENTPEKNESVSSNGKQPENEKKNDPIGDISDKQREEISDKLETVPFDDLINQIHAKEIEVRSRERARVTKHSNTSYPQHGKSLDGEYFIEDLGIVRQFENGTPADFFYDERALGLREEMLQLRGQGRKEIFDHLVDLLPEKGTVLSIGSSTDSTPIQSFLNAGHKVIVTDAGKLVVDCFTKKMPSVPTFACDLSHVGEIVQPESIDYLFANSTLGYIDPRKLPDIVAQLCSIMKKGGVFTFDMAPHPTYFRIAEEKTACTVANESDIDPIKAIELIEKYGPREGIAALNYYYTLRYFSVQMGTIMWLSNLFEEHGLHTQHSVLKEVRNTPINPLHILRVAKGSHPIVMGSSEEAFIVDEHFWDSFEPDGATSPFVAIDRKSGSRLAHLLRLNVSPRQAPWVVAQYYMESLDPSALPREAREEIKSFFHPDTVQNRLQEVADGKSFSQGLSLNLETAYDQIIHRRALLQCLSLGYWDSDIIHEADAHIDAEIYKLKQRRHTDQQIAIQQKEKEKRREKKKKHKRR